MQIECWHSIPSYQSAWRPPYQPGRTWARRNLTRLTTLDGVGLFRLASRSFVAWSFPFSKPIGPSFSRSPRQRRRLEVVKNYYGGWPLFFPCFAVIFAIRRCLRSARYVACWFFFLLLVRYPHSLAYALAGSRALRGRHLDGDGVEQRSRRGA
jgi:hypothetical protein